MSEQVSKRLSRDDARLIWKQAVARNDIVAWVITKNPSDFPGKFVARPWSVETGEYFHAHLEADFLDAIREELPPGLVRMGREHGEDPVIIETWIWAAAAEAVLPGRAEGVGH